MFENLLKTLNTLSEPGALAFDIEADEKGYVDHQCPDPRCMFRFKVRPKEGSADRPWTCPMCGHEAARTSFYTTEQVAQAREMALARVRGSIGQAMRQDARAVNGRQRSGGFLKMSMHVSGTEAWQPVDVPIAATESMQLEIACTNCQAEYAVLGAGFFCPLCGTSPAARVFDDALRKISAKKDHAPDVRAAIAATSGKDQAELVVRSLIETCLLDGVVAFQRFCEVTYRQLPGVEPPPFNAFQRLNDGSKLWRAALGQGYEDWTSPADLETLKLLFQRRHLLAHSDGVVDQKYLANTLDASYKEGQRIVVTTADVDNLLRVLSVLGTAIRARIQ